MARSGSRAGASSGRSPGSRTDPVAGDRRASASFTEEVRREAQSSTSARSPGIASRGVPALDLLAQDKYLEVRTLLAGYLLSSQGDRMLMAHSVEGRFPFLDANVVKLANSLPPSFKLRGLDEKHVLKRAAAGLVPEAVLRRPKQPYRAPDALSFVGPGSPGVGGGSCWPSPPATLSVGVFDPRAVDRLWRKCNASGGGEQFSNADNMALVGVLSTGLLHEQLVRATPSVVGPGEFRTLVDHLPAQAAGRSPAEGAEARRAT